MLYCTLRSCKHIDFGATCACISCGLTVCLRQLTACNVHYPGAGELLQHGKNAWMPGMSQTKGTSQMPGTCATTISLGLSVNPKSTE